jgi:excinuclease ABC subunit A
LYLLDEPTVGLGAGEVDRLVHVLHQLVEAGGTVVVVEHNLDLIAAADWVVDLGPEASEAGGRIVAEGPPEAIIDTNASHTGRFLRQWVKGTRNGGVVRSATDAA